MSTLLFCCTIISLWSFHGYKTARRLETHGKFSLQTACQESMLEHYLAISFNFQNDWYGVNRSEIWFLEVLHALLFKYEKAQSINFNRYRLTGAKAWLICLFLSFLQVFMLSIIQFIIHFQANSPTYSE